MGQEKTMREHTIEVRTRYAETDQMGVVYYANYLVWFEIVRTEFFRASGLDYNELERKEKIYLPVVEAYCRYKAPLKYDDLVTVTAKLTKIEASRITFEYYIKKDGKIKTTGMTKHVFVNGKGKTIQVPQKVRVAFK